MAQTWGVETAKRARAKRPADKSVSGSGHKGIVWIHVAAIGIWLFTAAILGALWFAGKNVPGAIVIGGLVAAAGHGVFVLVHLYLARKVASQK